jgi:DNA-binding MarR family transcriptional regulator
MDANHSAADEPLVLDRFLPYRLSILSNTMSGAIARLYEERFGLTILEWRIMAVLGLDAPLSANGVCERTRMDKVQVSRAVSRLLEKGLLSRKLADDDRRRSVLSLSAKGRRVYGDIAPLTAEWEARLLDALSPAELSAIDSLVTKLQDEADRLANGEQVRS